MKKSVIIWLVVCAIVIGACILLNREEPVGDDVLVGNNGAVVKGPNKETYRPHSGVVGKVEEVPAGDTKEDGVKEYRLSGAWAWNEQIVATGAYEADGAVPVATLTFSSPRYEEQEYTIYFLDGEQVALYYLSEDMTNIYNDEMGWYDITLRIMDLGESGQVVSEEFYEFFKQNATPIAADAYAETVEQYAAMHNNTVSGYWVWNMELSYARLREFPLVGQFASGVDFQFTSVEPEGLQAYVSDIPVGTLCVYNFSGPWWDARDRYMNLGETPQPLSPEAYVWFIKNARPCTKGTFDTMCMLEENEQATCIQLPYRDVQWNEDMRKEVDWDAVIVNRDWEISGNFLSNGQYFELIRGVWDKEADTYTVYYGVHTKLVEVFSTGEWTNEAYRSISAVSEKLWCSPEARSAVRYTFYMDPTVADADLSDWA